MLRRKKLGRGVSFYRSSCVSTSKGSGEFGRRSGSRGRGWPHCITRGRAPTATWPYYMPQTGPKVASDESKKGCGQESTMGRCAGKANKDLEAAAYVIYRGAQVNSSETHSNKRIRKGVNSEICNPPL